MSNTKIQVTAGGLLDLIDTGRELFELSLKFMDAVETVGKLKGAEKLEWVLAKVREYAQGDWNVWKERLTKFINTAKTVWNLAKGGF